MICECCGANAGLTVSRWSCRTCPDQHAVCLICLGKVSEMQGISAVSEFTACPKSLVTAFELAPAESRRLKSAKQWTKWWGENA